MLTLSLDLEACHWTRRHMLEISAYSDIKNVEFEGCLRSKRQFIILNVSRADTVVDMSCRPVVRAKRRLEPSNKPCA
jgi:hypothetical protein